MKKLIRKKSMLALGVATATLVGVIAFTQSIKADQTTTQDRIGLEIEKQDKETLIISLTDVPEVLKAIQFSIKIEGDVTFNEESIVSKVTASNNGNVNFNVMLSDNKKELEFIIVSDASLSQSAGTIEIAQVDISSLNNKAVKYEVKSKIKSDGTAYKYVVSTTNKQVSGPEMTLINEGILTYNTAPTLTLVQSPQVVEGKIILTLGDELTDEIKKSFVIAHDDEDGDEITLVVEGNVDTSIVGSYKLTYIATDSLGESISLEVPVIVENQAPDYIENPVITGVKDEVTLTIGDVFNPLENVEAIDYLGRQLDIVLSGDFTSTLVDGRVTKDGIYTIYFDTEDRLGNVAAQQMTTLIVLEKDNEVVPPVTPPTEGGGETTPPVTPPTEGGGEETTPPVTPPTEGDGGETTPPVTPPTEGDGGETTPPVTPPTEGDGGETTPPVTPPSTDDDAEGTDNVNPDNEAEDQNNHSMTRPATGYSVMGWMIGGLLMIVTGYVLYSVYNKRQK